MKNEDFFYYAVLLPVLPIKRITSYEQQGRDKQNTFTEWMNFDEKIMSGSVDNSELIWMLGQFPHFV